jgi:hydroxymethylbilane synthase
MLPAVGQGSLAIQCRENDDEVKKLLAQIDHDGTRRAVEAERAFARRLGANCRTPIAAHARIQTGKLAIDGMVATLNGRTLIRCGIVSDNPDAGRVGEELAELIIAKGAANILEAA